ncbi:MAG: ZIP family metal transporter [Patescibacteria group bacterium]|nr:ZIP family metal transporter [Patescibacteria group bacterium]
MIWLTVFISVLIISLVSLIGVFTFAISEEKLKKILLFLVSFSVGSLFGSAFFHLIPEAVEEFGFGKRTAFLLLIGLLGFFILEKFIGWRHCHLPTTASHPHPLTYLNIIGDAVHNFIDGSIMAGAYLISFPLGLSTTLAVIFHEIPQEIGDFGVLIYGGFSKWRALFFNFLSALSAFLGAVITLLLSNALGFLVNYLLPFAAGGFLYLAGSDLIPELKKETSLKKSFIQFVFIVLGLSLMFFLKIIFHQKSI